MPYGPKSPDTVRRYSREIAGFLRDQGVKSIVIACNTATAHALSVLREELDMPVIGVVEPGARAAVAATTRGHIGVIGTAGTIKSGAYERAIRALDPDAIDHGARLSALRSARRRGLDRPRGDAPDRARVSRAARRRGDRHARARLHALSAAQAAAARRARPRRAPHRQRRGDGRGNGAHARAARTRGRRRGADPIYRFIASDDPLQFLQLGQRFLGGTIEGVEIRTLG